VHDYSWINSIASEKTAKAKEKPGET